MILKALYDYYERCKDALPPYQTAYVNFRYAILIDKNGKFKGFESLGDDNGIALLTFRPEERTSSPIPHSLGDNGSYVLGLKDVKIGKQINIAEEIKKNHKNYEAFVEDVKRLYNILPLNEYVKAVYLFYQQYNQNTIEAMQKDPNWEGLCRSLNKNITFRIVGNTVLSASDKEVIKNKIDNVVNENESALCLVTGQKAKPVNTTYSTYINKGKSNAKLVSFQISSGYDSYGKKMGLNAPISEEAEFKYTTALNHLLRTNSRNKFFIGNRTFIFWASNNNEAGRMAEEGIFSMFGFQENNEDPNQKIEQVRKVFEAIYKGNLKTSLDDRFYILGLAPNLARIAVTYWAEILLKDFAELINRHFLDMEIVDGRKEQKPYSGLRSILSAVTLDGKVSEVTPNLPEAVVKSIFQGLSYPQPLFASCMRRIRAELDNKKWDDAYKKGWVTTRAAIIKAYLNRLKNKEQKIDIMLDKENKNQGYLCGRLFAVLERIQEISNRENDYFTNLRSNYMNSASTAPSTVLPTILNLSVHHSDKLDRKDMILFERKKQEIINKLKGFPNHLSMDDQGRFFIGYYHQRQDFFIKSEENNNEE